MLGSLSLILVYLGNVGGNIRWLTISEKPIEFGDSSKPVNERKEEIQMKNESENDISTHHSAVYPMKLFSLFPASHR